MDPTSGSIKIDGRRSPTARATTLKALHRDMQMVFQDPYSSLNPRKTVGSIIADPYVIHGLYKERGRAQARVQDLMDRVGLNPEHYNRYPHEFSGGQRQRIGVARRSPWSPKLLIADEPVSALDVSIQAQVLNLLRELQRDHGPDADLHRSRPLGRAPHVRPRSGHVPGQDRRAGARRRRSTHSRATPTPARCCRQCRCPIPPAASASASCSPATFPARPTRRRRAASTPAARRPSSFARGGAAAEASAAATIAACHFPLTEEVDRHPAAAGPARRGDHSSRRRVLRLVGSFALSVVLDVERLRRRARRRALSHSLTSRKSPR